VEIPPSTLPTRHFSMIVKMLKNRAIQKSGEKRLAIGKKPIYLAYNM
jgi:hypothetical protein